MALNPDLSFLNFNYICVNLLLCELTDQAQGRECLCPPQARLLPQIRQLLKNRDIAIGSGRATLSPVYLRV